MLTKLDVPSLDRCRKLARIMKGVKPYLHWHRWRRNDEESWSQWEIDLAVQPRSNAEADSEGLQYAPCFTLGQMFAWAARQGWEPLLGIVPPTCKDGGRPFAEMHGRPDDEFIAPNAPNALANAIIAARGD